MNVRRLIKAVGYLFDISHAHGIKPYKRISRPGTTLSKQSPEALQEDFQEVGLYLRMSLEEYRKKHNGQE